MVVGVAPDYTLVKKQQFSKAKLPLNNHVDKNYAIDDCDPLIERRNNVESHYAFCLTPSNARLDWDLLRRGKN